MVPISRSRTTERAVSIRLTSITTMAMTPGTKAFLLSRLGLSQARGSITTGVCTFPGKFSCRSFCWSISRA